MLAWLRENHQIIGVALSLGMLMVWVVYLQVFVSSYRRQLRANILITMGGRTDLASRCLVSNMSTGAIYIHSILLEVELPERILTRSVTETEGIEEWDKPTDLNLWTRQGPLQPGEVRDMGAFEVMLDHVLRSDTGGSPPGAVARDDVRALKVRIIAIYGSEDLPVAAERRFAVLRGHDAVQLSPLSSEAHQVRSPSRRRRIRRTLQSELRQERDQAVERS